MLDTDAIIFGLAYLNGPKATLSFGGEGADMEITPRARAALKALLGAGYAVADTPKDQIIGREHYRGTDKPLGPEAERIGLNPFSDEHRWPTFVRRYA